MQIKILQICGTDTQSYETIPNFSHITKNTLKLGTKQGLKGQTRAQIKDDTTGNSIVFKKSVLGSLAHGGPGSGGVDMFLSIMSVMHNNLREMSQCIWRATYQQNFLLQPGA
jgi:hypothetical protein